MMLYLHALMLVAGETIPSLALLPRGGGGGGGDCHIKVTGVHVGFFEFCGRGSKLILPLRGTKIKHNLSYS